MNQEQTERLAGCFKKVLPKLSRAEIGTATQENTAAWDSIAQVTLISLVGEEFGIELDFEEFEEATSFAAFFKIVDAKLSAA
jgi:acyl carrier protein